MASDGDLYLLKMLMASFMKKPIIWVIFISILIFMNTVLWYFRFNLFTDIFNTSNSNNTIINSMGNIAGVFAFRLFEALLIIGFCIYLFKDVK